MSSVFTVMWSLDPLGSGSITSTSWHLWRVNTASIISPQSMVNHVKADMQALLQGLFSYSPYILSLCCMGCMHYTWDALPTDLTRFSYDPPFPTKESESMETMARAFLWWYSAGIFMDGWSFNFSQLDLIFVDAYTHACYDIVLYNRTYFTCLIFMIRQSSTKPMKIGSLESFCYITVHQFVQHMHH